MALETRHPALKIEQMKIQIPFFFALLATMSFASCNGTEQEETLPGYPLQSFSLSIGSTNYNGNINQEDRTVTIGVIRYGSEVEGVDYTLCDGATISPDPESFVGAWPQTQDFTVTSGSEKSVYTVTLTAYIGEEPEPEDPGSDLPPAGEVIFFDGFDQDSVLPDENSWVLCTQDGGSAWSKYMSGSYDQAFIEDGCLVLQSEKVDGEYRAGGVQTMGKVWFKHARVEVCARFKTAQGAWPAIWLMPENERQPEIYQGWPNGGEVDIMEQISNETVVYQTVHTHYTYDLGIKDPVTTATPSYNVGEFNTYAVDMTPEELIFYVNGQEQLRYPNLHLENEAEMKQWPFDGDFYLILNVALGGEGTWPGAIEDSELPARMEVDWVRVSELL